MTHSRDHREVATLSCNTIANDLRLIEVDDDEINNNLTKAKAKVRTTQWLTICQDGSGAQERRLFSQDLDECLHWLQC